MICDETVDFEIIQGNDEAITVKFTDEDGLAINITGCKVYFTMKKRPDDSADDSTAVIKKDITSHTNPTGGETTIDLARADTENLEARKYYYDIQIKDTNDKISSSRYGIIEVIEDISNRTS